MHSLKISDFQFASCASLVNPVRLSRSYVVSQPWRIAQALMAGWLAALSAQPATTANPAQPNSSRVGNWFQFRMGGNWFCAWKEN